MTDKISSGAYIIRNLHTSTVLHIEKSTLTSDYSVVLAHEQDENKYRDNQVWWVEPLAENDGGWYSITNTACGKILDEEGSGRVCAAKPHGAPWQAWRIKKVRTGEEGDFYTIIGAQAEKVIAIETPPVKPVPTSTPTTAATPTTTPTTAVTQKIPPPKKFVPNYRMESYITDHDQHCWEFVLPIVSFPVGWFQIQNIGTGALLTHKYLHNPPILLSPSSTSMPSQHRETWGTQWTLAESQTVAPDYKHRTGRNTWYVVNRLTGGLLSNAHMTAGAAAGCGGRRVIALGRNWCDSSQAVWKLELDRACNWTMMHHSTLLLLEQVKGSPGEVACVSKRTNLGVRNRSWAFKAPVLEVHDEEPPDYDTTDSSFMPRED